MRAKANDGEGKGGEGEQEKSSDLATAFLMGGCIHRGAEWIVCGDGDPAASCFRAWRRPREPFVLDLTRCGDHNPLTLWQARPGVCQDDRTPVVSP